jgi:hypothetical protein
MNWAVGLCRLWLLLSAAWMAFMVIGFGILPSGDHWSRFEFSVFFWATVGPPIALFIVGCAIAWALAGFRQL